MQGPEDAIRSVLEGAIAPAGTFAASRGEGPGGAIAGSRPAPVGTPTGVAPGAAAVAGTATERTRVVVTGVRRFATATRDAPPVEPDTRFDLASLTKVMATLPAVLALVADGAIDLDDPVRRFVSNAGWFQRPSLGDVVVRDLLGHTSGLPAWKPVFAQASTRLTAVANVLQTPLEGNPGTRIVYSDLGFIVLGHIVEGVTGLRLDAFVRERVFAPLGLGSLGFRPTDSLGGPEPGVTFAATEDCGWRNAVLEGVVHDENAWAMDGVAGHAGLFGAADDVATYAQAWLRAAAGGGVTSRAASGGGVTSRAASGGGDSSRAGQGRTSTRGVEPVPLPFPAALALECIREHARTPEIRRGIGWQLASSVSPAGERAGSRSFGHTGFTGTSIWIDPDADWFAVLLTNRVHPSRERGLHIGRLRETFHQRVALAVAEERGDAPAGTSGGLGPEAA